MGDNTCGDSCVFPVANLSSKSMQTCDQKCSYYADYFGTSSNNTILNEAPYTMGKFLYSGKSRVSFNGVTYSNTDENNNIVIAITKPLHSFKMTENEEGTNGMQGAGELIIMHQKNNTGTPPLWVCIPLVNSSIQAGSTGTRPGSTAIVEAMIDNLPGVPYALNKDGKILLRRADSSAQGYGEYTYESSLASDRHRHTEEQGGSKHSHYHVPGIGHAGDDAAAAAFMQDYTAGQTQISNQNDIGISFKLNDVIPFASYFFYKGVFNSTTDLDYQSCENLENIDLNVVVFDIKDGIPISSVYAALLDKEWSQEESTYPLLMNHTYTAMPDTYNNVSFHSKSFTNSEDDDIYIDCRPVNFKDDDFTNTVLESTTSNKSLEEGVSIINLLTSFVNSKLFAMIIGIIVMFIVYKSGRLLLRIVFGKQAMPSPDNIMGADSKTTSSK